MEETEERPEDKVNREFITTRSLGTRWRSEWEVVPNVGRSPQKLKETIILLSIPGLVTYKCILKCTLIKFPKFWEDLEPVHT